MLPGPTRHIINNVGLGRKISWSLTLGQSRSKKDGEVM